MFLRFKTFLLCVLIVPAALAETSFKETATTTGPSNPWQAVRTSGTDPTAIERSILARASRRSVEQQLEDYLGTFPAAAASRRPTDAARVSRLAEDPAIATYYRRIRDEWFQGALSRWGGELLFSTYREFLQCKVMISRNLYFRDLDVSAAAVRQEYSRIQALRMRYRDLGLFSNRRVIFAASQDRLRANDDYVFGRGPTRRRMEFQAGSFSFLRSAGGESRSHLTEALRESAAAGEALTFVYDGHGRNTGFDFGGGYSYRRLVDALASEATVSRRSGESPILILSACRSHTFARKFLNGLRDRGSGRPMPILILPDEYGQDTVKEVYQEPFFRSDLRLTARDEARLGTLFSDARMPASVYVPDQHVVVQIA